VEQSGFACCDEHCPVSCSCLCRVVSFSIAGVACVSGVVQCSGARRNPSLQSESALSSVHGPLVLQRIAEPPQDPEALFAEFKRWCDSQVSVARPRSFFGLFRCFILPCSLTPACCFGPLATRADSC
jgi:hypothetical protein